MEFLNARTCAGFARGCHCLSIEGGRQACVGRVPGRADGRLRFRARLRWRSRGRGRHSTLCPVARCQLVCFEVTGWRKRLPQRKEQNWQVMSLVSMSVRICRRITLVMQTLRICLAGCTLIHFLDTLECRAYVKPSKNIAESESFLLFLICKCQTHGIGSIKTATSVAKFREASMM